MTAVDTNVVVRYLVGDDAEQAEAARKLIDRLTSSSPGFICREVVIEVAWVLERSYRFTRAQIAEVLMGLTASDSLVVENSDDVAAAAHRYRQGGAGFADLMILSAAEREGATSLHTFDCRLARLGGSEPSRAQHRRCVAMKDSQKPDHVSLGNMVSHLREGWYVIPDFQRDFEWEPWDINELMRSIFRDYYIGSLLLWKGKDRKL